MATVEYKLNDKGDGMAHKTGIILLGITETNFMKKLTEEEINLYLADAITHEFIHELLEVEFNFTTCKLFDLIQECFRTDMKILQKVLKDTNCRTWDEAKRKDGVQYLLDKFEINNTSLNQAYLICNTRLNYDNR